MLIKKSDDIKSSEITDQQLFLNRRNFMRAATLAATTTATGWLYRHFTAPATESTTGIKIADVQSASGSTQVPHIADQPTSYQNITHYNNFYEFTTDKSDVAYRARNFVTRPWTVGVEGLVNKPRVYDLDDILKIAPAEERVYRHRCVEGWSMIIPWVGFSLAKLLQQVEPLARAKYVAFETLADPQQMTLDAGLAWPYVEGLRLDEALHPLTLLASGLYGETLPPQNGAPLRLVVPWKYGFKSIKSIIKIKLVENEPATTWNRAAPEEYGFYSNVNPRVDHPRWSQATERRIGELGRRDTLMFNGYGEQVAQLYAGMDLRTYF